MENTRKRIDIYESYLLKKRLTLLLAFAALIIASFVYMGIGSMRISLADILNVLTGQGEAKYRAAIWNIRLPRLLAAISVGAILASSGAVMQCVLRNPLSSASTLGVSQGAAFGAAIGIVVFGGGVMTNANSSAGISVSNPYTVTLCAFLFGSISSIVVIGISQLKRDIGPAGLILAGTALAAMFSGGSTLLQYFSDDTSLGAIVFWTFGNLGNAGWNDLKFICIVLVFSYAYYFFNRWNYNAMEAGYDTAKSLGIDTRSVMIISMAVCSLSAAVAVSFVGIISFVGLIAPHVVRFFTGNDHRYLIPGSAVVGALLLIFADILAKVIAPPIILPIGAIMSFVGGPVFLALLFRRRSHNG